MFCANCGTKIEDGVQFCPKCGTPAGATAPVAPTQAATYTLASSGKRFGNLILDTIFIYVVNFGLGFLLGIYIVATGSSLEAVHPYTGLIGFGGWIGYFLVTEGIWGRSLGKFITKTKVVMTDGSKPDFSHILGRTFARIIPFELFSFFGATPRGWHDRLSGTLVVPDEYTPEEVKQIALPKPGSLVVIIIAGVFGIAIIGILAAVVLVSLNSARAKSRDALRTSDVRIVQTALELYRLDKGEYPDNLSALEQGYLSGGVPIPPTPSGLCDSNSEYQYSGSNSQVNPMTDQPGFESYTFSFCLEGDSGGYTAGDHVATETGIK